MSDGEKGLSIMELSQINDLVINIISNVGFPIFISLYLLQRLEKKVDEMVDVLTKLSQSLSQQ